MGNVINVIFRRLVSERPVSRYGKRNQSQYWSQVSMPNPHWCFSRISGDFRTNQANLEQFLDEQRKLQWLIFQCNFYHTTFYYTTYTHTHTLPFQHSIWVNWYTCAAFPGEHNITLLFLALMIVVFILAVVNKLSFISLYTPPICLTNAHFNSNNNKF